MSEDAKRLVQEQFSQNAEAYVTSVTHGRGASLQRIVELTQPHHDELALDVATAVGHTALALAPRVDRVIGLDLTPAMMVPARRLAAERNIANVEWTIGDVEDLPLSDESFDIVVCRIALHHWPDAPRGIREMARVAKPHGRVVLVDNVVPPDATLAQFVNHYERVRDPSHHWCYPLDELTAMVGAAGLRVTLTETLDKPTAFDDWVKRMNTPAEQMEELHRLMHSPEAAATIRPEGINGVLYFHLTEAIVSAVK